MNINNNYYQDTDYRYTEIGIALSDFTYGNTVNVSIPTITPFMNTSSEVTTTTTVSTVNIINDDIAALGLSTNASKKFKTSNNMALKVPWYLADIKEKSPTKTTSSSDHHSHNINLTDMIGLDFNGTKGTRFIISFVGGELNNARIIGRMD